jgi:N-acetylmannosamine-6-phosphate 2-epimerase/N-acetylmannosamine kinase
MRALLEGGMNMKRLEQIDDRFHGRLIVSCQAPDGIGLRDSRILAALAQAAVAGGAAGIRADGPENIAAIRKSVTVPIIGIAKRKQNDGKVLITPSFESARELVEAGADAIALDCTSRGQRLGAFERLQRIRTELKVPALADIATFEEARAAQQAGADYVLTTLRGYTPETEHIREFDVQFVRDLASSLDTPVIAEGRIATPQHAASAIQAGAFAVIVGTAITRPDVIVRKFLSEIERVSQTVKGAYAIGVDLGATNTKFALAKSDGSLLWQGSQETPAMAGRSALLQHLYSVVALCARAAAERGVVPAAVGVATAGWVNPSEGNVIFATGNLPGWSGVEIRSELERTAGLPVAVANDANAMAVAERRFGLGKSVDNFLCLTLGTGVGGGCYVGGRLNQGAHFLGNAFGHIRIERPGLPCTCGQTGCLEVYANAAALVRYAGKSFASAQQVTKAAAAGDAAAWRAMREYAGYLSRGLSTLVHVLDPELIVLSGGIAEGNQLLLEDLEEELAQLVIGWNKRRLRLALSDIACYGGVIGAAAVALEEVEHRSRNGAESV